MTAIETELHPFIENVRCVVALPVMGDGGDLDAGLNAIFSQVDRYGRPLEPEAVKVVVAHAGSLEAGRIARHWQARYPEALHIVEHLLPEGVAAEGKLRQFSVETAAMIAGELPVLLTEPGVTVALDWVQANLAALRNGADIVAGVVRQVVDAAPEQHAYRMLLAEIDARLDPLAHDLWPRHGYFSFASLAIRPAVLQRTELRLIMEAGPCSAVRLLRQSNFSVRHALEPEVTGTAAVHGAPAFEPAFRAFSRARWRGEMRRHHAQRLEVVAAWEGRLRVQPGSLCEEWHTLSFDALWDRAEQISPLLAPRRLNPIDLPEEMRQAANLLAGLRSADPGQRTVRRTMPQTLPAKRRAAAAA
jgi:hypothetical protein